MGQERAPDGTEVDAAGGAAGKCAVALAALSTKWVATSPLPLTCVRRLSTTLRILLSARRAATAAVTCEAEGGNKRRGKRACINLKALYNNYYRRALPAKRAAPDDVTCGDSGRNLKEGLMR